MPPELVLESDALEIEEKLENEDKVQILQFVNTLCSNFPAQCLILLYNNLRTLQIRDTHHKKHFSKPTVPGTYDIKKNEVEIRDCSVYDPIYHELFHLSSSVIQNKTKFCGFSQNSFGNGINEGYTQLLTERYFLKKSAIDISYPFQKRIMQVIEIIVEKEKMEQLYLQANLKGLIESLMVYASEREIMCFISDMDFILYYLDKLSLLPFKKHLLNKSLENITIFLANIIIKYLIHTNNENIDEEE